MLNLLQKVQKKEISREYRVRFFVVGFSLTLVGGLISLILLVPPFLTAETRIEMLNAQSAGFKAQNVTTEISKLSDVVRKTNGYLSLFVSSSTPTGIVATIGSIVDIRGGAVQINSLEYKAQGGQQQISIRGVAGSRQALLDYIKKIKLQPGVVSADLPVSDFAQSQNIDFSLTVSIKPQHI